MAHPPMRRGSMSERPRAQSMAAVTSATRSCMLWFSQLPGAPSMPGLFQDNDAYPARAKASQRGR